MSRVQKKLVPVEIDYVCDKCNKGKMRLDIEVVELGVTYYHHRCNKSECNHLQIFTEIYPTIRYVPDGTKVNLLTYTQTITKVKE